LADKQQDREQDSISNEGAPHYEMSQALTQVVCPTESKGGDPSKEHLHPADHWHNFSYYAMSKDDEATYAPMDPLLQM